MPFGGDGRDLRSGDTAYPTRPINLMVPFAPDGSSDILARVLEPALVRDLG
jgi:tripartite-type tricarboxylate transporter receptor subunit TctC